MAEMTDMLLATTSAPAKLGEGRALWINRELSWLSSYRKLAIAPDTLRSVLLAKIEAQTERAKAHKAARIFAKVNSLVDSEIARALCRASEAGVQVDLVVRGVCCLRPGVPGVSGRIRVFSIIGRFLEHERVFVFGTRDEGHDSDEEFFLASADLMPRNLDRRVEILFPIASQALRDRIRAECIAPLALDTCRVYELGADGRYMRRTTPADEPQVDAQLLAWSGTASLPPARRATNGHVERGERESAQYARITS